MKRIKLTALHIKAPKINTTAVLIGAAILFVLATFAYGAVRKVQLDKATAAAHASQVAAQQAQKQASDKAFKEVTTELNTQKGKAAGACAELAKYASAKATAKLVSYPAICNVK